MILLVKAANGLKCCQRYFSQNLTKFKKHSNVLLLIYMIIYERDLSAQERNKLTERRNNPHKVRGQQFANDCGKSSMGNRIVLIFLGTILYQYIFGAFF